MVAACIAAMIAVFPATASAATASWTIVPSPNPGVIDALNDVTCVSASDCWAVGEPPLTQPYPKTTLIEHYNGSSWTIVASPTTTDGDHPTLFGVSCASASDCWAVGTYTNRIISIIATLIVHYNGSNWTIISSPSPGSSNRLQSVKCVNANNCWAVGEGTTGNGHQQLIEQYTGGSWVVVPGLGFGSLTDVACLSLLGDCWAVGYYGTCATGPTPGNLDCPLIEHNPGTGWVLVPSPFVTNMAFLNGVTCTSANDCWAVGDRAIAGKTLIEHYDGSSWTIVPSPNFGRYPNHLTDVSCASAGDCWAVGYTQGYRNGVVGGTLIEHNTGSGWVIVKSPSGKTFPAWNLKGIKCVSAADCWAVGATLLSYTSTGTLIEHYK
jgi:hypothetical protein